MKKPRGRPRLRPTSVLTPREEQVLKMRLGLDEKNCPDGKRCTLEAIGEKYGVTKERIRQIEAKALRKLRYPSRREDLFDYFNPSNLRRRQTNGRATEFHDTLSLWKSL